MPSLSERPTPERQALQAATEGLYTTFASYPLRDVITGCIHCLQQTDVDHLHAVPLRLLTKEDLEGFLGNNAAGTVGDALDFKHFLPRLLELVAWEEAEYSLVFLPETVSTGVSRHGYATWPQAEQQALRTFCLAWWQAVLATAPRQFFRRDERVETILCAVSQFTEDVTPYLAAWRRTRSGTALTQLWVFIRYHLMDTNAERWMNPWWGGRERQWQQVEAWVRDPATAIWLQEVWERIKARQQQEPPPAVVRLHEGVLNWLAQQTPNE